VPWLALAAVVVVAGVELAARSGPSNSPAARAARLGSELACPVCDGESVALQPGEYTVSWTRGPEYNLDKSLDLGALFGNALKQEAVAMGFAASGASAWQVDGTIKDVYVESKQIPYGATLFWGFMDVDFRVAHGGAAPQTVSLRLHNYNGGYNAGMGRKDEAEAALAHLLVEGAQDALARLNRLHFRAPAPASVAALLDQVKKPGDKGLEPALHRLSLSGAPGAAPVILDLIPKEPDENRRSALIEALGRLGTTDAVPVLTKRYATEDEDCRWYTLKALDYIGGTEAEAHVKGAGVGDKDGGPRRLAEKIAGKK